MGITFPPQHRISPVPLVVGNRVLRASTQSVPVHSRDGRESLFGEETPCASFCPGVVASSGALTAYSGGLAAKEYLLALESRP